MSASPPVAMRGGVAAAAPAEEEGVDRVASLTTASIVRCQAKAAAAARGMGSGKSRLLVITTRNEATESMTLPVTRTARGGPDSAPVEAVLARTIVADVDNRREAASRPPARVFRC
ncbi:MAG TPA: hypothetical protein VEL07_05335 [Planctomycetota bacterium]|nr:hypothetical protein [Planctomycetota bacterium]